MNHLPPYNDLENCKLLCKRWYNIVQGVKRHTYSSFHKNLADYNLYWKPLNQANEITSRNYTDGPPRRFSHASVVHRDCMYIFGGGSSTSTTFNDLWRFDLSNRQWTRMQSFGSYPSPKACSTMVCYKDNLILFGGWRHPPSYPPYQSWRLFDELHSYDLKENRWTAVNPLEGPPPMTGHSATIHRNEMVVFGGHQQTPNEMSSSNQVWCLNLETFTWRQPQTSALKPPARYGQFQIHIDDTHLLILGGCGGPNNMFSDCWLLDMSNDLWIWKAITIQNKKWAASHMWCNPACKVGSKLVILGPTTQTADFQMVRHQMPSASNLARQPARNEPPIRNIPPHNPDPQQLPRPSQLQVLEQANRRLQEHKLINKNRNDQQANASNSPRQDDAASRRQRNLLLRSREENHFMPQRFDEPLEERLGMAAFSVPEQPANQRRMEHLLRMEEKLLMRRPEAQPDSTPSPKRIKRNCIGVYLADISHVLDDEATLNWIEYKNFGMISGAPERLICSSLACGNGELIMFGGLRKQSALNDTEMEKRNVGICPFSVFVVDINTMPSTPMMFKGRIQKTINRRKAVLRLLSAMEQATSTTTTTTTTNADTHHNDFYNTGRTF
ncbi:F-box only protein 42 [Pseudolycoriella hygida]|uniref:F-box only protein 42 n=1 Tax=Pseudolycoriella hygida TaxID=35572 RepID=A0A9Q0S639_9DIPT|nr:F-box only protein 42 [Pseudolycoriella hygida]